MTLADDVVTPSGVRRVSPVRQVLTIFGDYWWHVTEPMPTGALLAALMDLGLKEAAARATLARMGRTGLLEVERSGRRTAHALTPRAVAVVDEEAAWLDSFGLVEQPWDGLWSVLAFSIPEVDRSLRHLARNRLRWLGFAPLYDGMWVSPRDAAARALAELRDLGVRDVTSMRARLETSITGGAQSAWDLAETAEEYRRFAAALGDSRDSAHEPDAFRERMRLMLAWQAFRELDTGLPAELLPEDWPRVETRRVWAGRYNDLADAAESRVRSFVGAIDPALRALVSSRRMPISADT